MRSASFMLPSLRNRDWTDYILPVTIIIIIALVLGVIVTAIWGVPTMPWDEKITTGVITERQYEPAHYETYTQCTSTGKSTICYPVVYHVGDQWFLRITNADGDTDFYRVPREVYDSLELGEPWSVPSIYQ